MFPVTDHVVKTPRHTSFYLACGEACAPMIFVHGWPELSISWRHQLPCFAALGFRAIAPDMRGYGRSSVHPRHEDYALEHIVADMIELLDSLGMKKRSGSGHDWGSPVVWEYREPSSRSVSWRGESLRAVFSEGLHVAGIDPEPDRSHDLSGGGVSYRSMGISIVLSRELRQGAYCVRGEYQGDGESDVS
jgi:hypothetical protein